MVSLHITVLGPRQVFYPSLTEAEAQANKLVAEARARWATCQRDYQEEVIDPTDEELTAEWGNCTNWEGPAAFRAKRSQRHEANQLYYNQIPTIVRVR